MLGEPLRNLAANVANEKEIHVAYPHVQLLIRRQRHVLQHSSGSLGQEVPRHCVAVVLSHRQHDLHQYHGQV